MKLPQKNIVVLGATSAIAVEISRRYAASGSRFFLAARNEEKTKAASADLIEKGGSVVAVHIGDLLAKGSHDAIVQQAVESLGTIDIVIVAHGVLPDQEAIARDVEANLDILMVTGLSPISLAHRFALQLEKQNSGSLVFLSSVAGDRGRGGNYSYGAAKAAMSAYAGGLRGQLSSTNVHVMTVKPGPVATPMMEGRQQPIVATVEKVASDITKGIEKKKLILYTPWFWRFIMLGFKMLPEQIIMKMKF